MGIFFFLGGTEFIFSCLYHVTGEYEFGRVNVWSFTDHPTRPENDYHCVFESIRIFVNNILGNIPSSLFSLGTSRRHAFFFGVDVRSKLVDEFCTPKQCRHTNITTEHQSVIVTDRRHNHASM